MKTRHLLLFLVLILSVFNAQPCLSQGTTTLKIVDMPGYPDLPGDTAYEGQSYTFEIILANNTNIFINSSISINLRVDSITSTVITNPAVGMQPGDTVTITVVPYNFTQPQYKMGNNIVVVWPVVNGMFVPIDSLQTDVFFVPLNSLGSNDLKDPAFHIYPVPSQDFLELNMENYEEVEYVRIYSQSGQLVKEIITSEPRKIDISFLENGLYVAEIMLEGKAVRRKFIKQ